MKSVSLLCVLLVAVGQQALAAPAPTAPAQSRRITLDAIVPLVPQTYTTRPAVPAVSADPAVLMETEPFQIAMQYTSLQTANLPLDSMRVSSSHVNKRNGVTHVYLQQLLHGLDVVNGVANVNVDQAHRVVSAGNNFFRNSGSVQAPPAATKLSAADAVVAFAKYANLASAPASASALQSAPAVNNARGTPLVIVSGAEFVSAPITAELKYIQIVSGSEMTVRLVWEFVAELAGADDVYAVAVDAETGEILSLINLVSDMSSYNVYPFGVNDPDSGVRQVLDSPELPVASPFGWHSQGILGRNFTDTQGNNVHSSDNPTGDTDYTNKYRPDGGQALNFDFPINLAQDPSTYQDAAITNLFYFSNIIHDWWYMYGFDEDAGNFQRNNFDKGGQPNDPVITFAQDGGGMNNANFYTPRDGIEGRMRMYLWEGTPRRDGDLDSGIIIHEYAHGLSNRLTGGPAATTCLGSFEPGGMGEGWGDILATVIRTTSNTTREMNYNMGGYANGNPNGIRAHIYSTNMTTNPSTYDFISRDDYTRVHRVGEVWAVMLYEVYWNLVDQYGFDSNWFNARSPAGNIVFVQNVIDGLKLQPCSPNFVMARDAILQADELNSGGWHKCAIWRGFAKRGLGVSAVGGTGWGASWTGVQAFDLPADCQ